LLGVFELRVQDLIGETDSGLRYDTAKLQQSPADEYVKGVEVTPALPLNEYDIAAIAAISAISFNNASIAPHVRVLLTSTNPEAVIVGAEALHILGAKLRDYDPFCFVAVYDEVKAVLDDAKAKLPDQHKYKIDTVKLLRSHIYVQQSAIPGGVRAVGNIPLQPQRQVMIANPDISAQQLCEHIKYRRFDEALDLLNAQGVEVNDRYGNKTPLFAALEMYSYYVAKEEDKIKLKPIILKLLELGADRTVEFSIGTSGNAAGLEEFASPFSRALKSRDPDIIRAFIDPARGKSIVNKSIPTHFERRTYPLSEVTENAVIVKLLLDAGANVNAEYIEKDNLHMGTPLGGAAMFGKVEVIDALITAGAKVTLAYLENACHNGNVEAAKVLILAGAPISFWGGEPVNIWKRHDGFTLLTLDDAKQILQMPDIQTKVHKSFVKAVGIKAQEENHQECLELVRRITTQQRAGCQIM
jgi:hypothetical protein